MKRFFLLVFLITLTFSYAFAADPKKDCVNMVEEAKFGNIEKVKHRLKLLCDVNVRDKNDMTPLMAASYNGHFEIVKLLLNEGAQVNLMDSGENGGFTALMMACIRGKYAVAKSLLSHGANPNIQRRNGKTALMGAVEGDYIAISRLLLDNGADVTIIDNDGNTAMMHAKNANNEKIVDLLKEYGAGL